MYSGLAQRPRGSYELGIRRVASVSQNFGAAWLQLSDQMGTSAGPLPSWEVHRLTSTGQASSEGLNAMTMELAVSSSFVTRTPYALDLTHQEISWQFWVREVQVWVWAVTAVCDPSTLGVLASAQKYLIIDTCSGCRPQVARLADVFIGD